MAFWIPAMVISSVVGGIYAVEKYDEKTFDPAKTADDKERLLRTKYKELIDLGHIAILDLKSGCLLDFDTNKMYVADSHGGHMAIAEVNSRTDGTPIRHFSSSKLDFLGDIAVNLNPIRIFGNTRAFGFVGYNNAEVWMDGDPICLVRDNPKGVGKEYYYPGAETFARRDFDAIKATMLEHHGKYRDSCANTSSETYKTYAKKFSELSDTAKKQVNAILESDPAIKPVLEQFLKSLKMDGKKISSAEALYVMSNMLQNNEIDIFTYRDIEKADGFQKVVAKFNIQQSNPLQRESAENQTALIKKGGAATTAKDSHSVLELLPDNVKKIAESILGSRFGKMAIGAFLLLGGASMVGALLPLISTPLLMAYPNLGPAVSSLGAAGKFGAYALGAYLLASPFIDAYYAKPKQELDLDKDLPRPNLPKTPEPEKTLEMEKAPEPLPKLQPLTQTRERVTKDVPDGSHIGLPKLGNEESKFASIIRLHKQEEAVHN